MTSHALFILLAQSSAKAKPSASPLTSFLPIILLFGVMWFVLLRPQQKKQREQRAMLGDLKQGDKVVAAGGIVGTIRRVDDDTLSIQVADNVVLKVEKGTVARKLPS